LSKSKHHLSRHSNNSLSHLHEMGPKPPKASGAKAKSQDGEKEEVLQAVVVADTFETKFAPFTLERPRCLLSLANTPLIEYTLDFLAQSGVEEIFFAAGSHTEQVEKYIDASRWRLKSSLFKKFTFLKSAATSVGDVMRDLDQKGLITGDFLAISGDVVSNFPIAEAMAKHKARRQRDKNAIMTMLLREMGPRKPSRERLVVPTFVIDPIKDRCLHYEESRSGESADLSIDPDMLSQIELEIRQDLVDCRIDICTPEMLSLWSDNFDNQSPRKDFLHGVLKDYELNGKTIHTYIVKNHFASRVADLRAYDKLSHDIASRWSFPECPGADAKYRFTGQGVYQEDSVTLARSCRVKSRSVIGRGTSIGDKSTVEDCIIGRYCQIGRNVRISNAYIWDHAVVQDDTTIIRAIIADQAVIGKGSSILDGALISFGVRIDQEVQIGKGSRLTRIRDNNSKPLFGNFSDGHPYIDEDEDGEVNVEPAGLGRRIMYFVPTQCLCFPVYQDQDFSASNSSLSSTRSLEAEVPSRLEGSRSQSFATTTSDDDGTDRFHHEAILSLFERMKKGTHQDDVRVELMGLRFAQNASENQVRRSVAVSLMKLISNRVEEEKVKVHDAVKESIRGYHSLIQRDQSQDAAEGQVDFLLEAQRDLISRREGEQILLHLAMELYNQDLFEEEIFSRWWNDDRSGSTEELKRVKESSRQFLNWLAAEDEDGDDDGGEDEDEDEDEEIEGESEEDE
jgi:translation initiation factor eIF-2B subunit epsilon